MIKEQKLSPSAEARDMHELEAATGNLYLTTAIIAKRANQIANELKTELHFKLEDMRKITDEIDEITESREQIELSKKYEKLAHPTLIATSEFLDGNLEYKELDGN